MPQFECEGMETYTWLPEGFAPVSLRIIGQYDLGQLHDVKGALCEAMAWVIAGGLEKGPLEPEIEPECAECRGGQCWRCGHGG